MRVVFPTRGQTCFRQCWPFFLLWILLIIPSLTADGQDSLSSPALSPFSGHSSGSQIEKPEPLDLIQTSPLTEYDPGVLAGNGAQDLALEPEFQRDPEKKRISPVADPITAEKVEELGTIGSPLSQFQVPLGQGRILTLKNEITEGENSPLIAIGNPSVIDVTIVSPKQLRVTGLRVGMTDLSITTAKGDNLHYEVQVLADLTMLQKKIRTTFPDASVHLSQIQNHVVVEGEARSQLQVTNIISLVSAYLDTITAAQRLSIQGRNNTNSTARENYALSPDSGETASKTTTAVEIPPEPERIEDAPGSSIQANPQTVRISGTIPNPSIVNLLRVPTSQQVLLKVRVAELNRTALRNIGANFLAVDPASGSIFGTQIAGPTVATGVVNPSANAELSATSNRLFGSASQGATSLGSRGGTTAFGIFQNANFEMPLNALRRNGLLKILAEPNLVALSGQQSSFLVGGEYPVPVPQVSSSGVAPTVTVRFKEFGVRLGFVPFVLDQENLRLTVAPEVSEIDFSISVTLVAGGSPVPGLLVRRSYTTVEMKHGQTLAIAGLLYLKLDGATDRIPGLGDMPILGPFFSNTSNERVEKELVILVTPYIVEPMEENEVPALPGSEVGEPTDWEFYFLNRIESREGVDFRSTTAWDNVQENLYLMKMQKKILKGQVGYSE